MFSSNHNLIILKVKILLMEQINVFALETENFNFNDKPTIE